MVLDDHEIADQFARDFTPVLAKTAREAYREEATIAYRDYVHARNPAPDEARAGGNPDSFWYRFDVGGARFFILDTRTQRFDHGSPRMIDERQMGALLEWMCDYRHDLKFIVTSVPFVAQIDEERPGRLVDTWYEPAAEPASTERQAPPRNPANDKWSATRFQPQRDQIIEHIARQGIEHVVFLTGDMHCCYQASMRIGEGSKYACTTIHELGAGPANQLQLANVAEFASPHRGRTSGSIPYEVLFERFHGEVSAVMHVAVEYQDADTGRCRRSRSRVERHPDADRRRCLELEPGTAAGHDRSRCSSGRASPPDGSWRAGDVGAYQLHPEAGS